MVVLTVFMGAIDFKRLMTVIKKHILNLFLCQKNKLAINLTQTVKLKYKETVYK